MTSEQAQRSKDEKIAEIMLKYNNQCFGCKMGGEPASHLICLIQHKLLRIFHLIIVYFHLIINLF